MSAGGDGGVSSRDSLGNVCDVIESRSRRYLSKLV